MEELLAELADEFGTGKIFRPYRDVRFSADKTPYKTNCAATIGSGYISFSRRRPVGGRWAYMPDPKALARYREAVDNEKSGVELVKIVAPRKEGYDTMAHEVLKTAPRATRRTTPDRAASVQGHSDDEDPAGRGAGHPQGQGPGGHHVAGRGAAEPVAAAERRLIHSRGHVPATDGDR